ncbi:MAG: hypothetical protein HC876_19100 [Chloroflexaceae bacterium]|nr:hypothetical protein [Chloroflexaceae bacterium]NJO07444.1 hypothetical protein [Chloroflexaceae bacterium]
MHHIYTTAQNVQIHIKPGKKSEYDFIVQYRELGKRLRTPQHIHFIIDLYMKKVGNKALTLALVDHIIEQIIVAVQPATIHPPRLQLFTSDQIVQFQNLDNYGEYSIEFLLVVIELIMIQEKTNYPTGTMNLHLFQRFRREDSIFSVVQAATFRGR